MVWFLVIIVVIAIYNAERLPDIMDKLKKEVPHLVDASKKMSHEIKEKAHNVQTKAIKKNNKEQSEKKENE